MEICKRGQKLGKSRLSNTKLINIEYPVDIFINLFQAVRVSFLCIAIAWVQNGCFVQISLKKE